MAFPTALARLIVCALHGLWLPTCCVAGAAAHAQPLLTSPATSSRGAVVVYVDDIAGGLLKGPLDSNGWTLISPFKQGRHSLTPLAAGRQVAVYQSVDSRNEAVTVFDVKTGQALFAQQLPKNTVIEAGPLFGNAGHYLLRTITGTSDGNRAFIVDLKAGAIASTLASGGLDTQYAELPDGRLYRLSKTTGDIAIGSADGAWTAAGRLVLPPKLRMLSWRLNHQGTKLAIVYALNSPGTVKTDVWVANIDGSGQYRLTDLAHTSRPVWSPDDSRIAFSFDTLSDMVGGLPGSAKGQCSYWHTPADARDVSGLVKGQPHAVAQQLTVNFSGIQHYPTCNLVAWERF